MRRFAAIVALSLGCLNVTAQPERVHTLITNGESHEKAGRSDEAARDYDAARAEAERLGNKSLTAKALLKVGYLRYMRGEMHEALVVLQRAYALSVQAKDSRLTRDALSNIANVYADSNVGQYDQALRYYEQLLVQTREAGDAEGTADTLFNIASTLERMGDLERALSMYRHALQAEQQLGRQGEVATVKRAMGVTLSRLNRPSEALPLFSEALHQFELLDDTDRVMATRLSRGVAYNRMEKYSAATSDLEVVEHYYKRQDNPRFLEKTMEELAKAYAGESRWPDAFRAKGAELTLARVLAEKLRDEETTRLRVQFDTERKEQDNETLMRQSEVNRRIRLLQTVLLCAAVVLVVLVSSLAIKLRSANASLRHAQEKIAHFNESSGEALRDVRAWSKATACELTEALHAKEVVVYIRNGGDLVPLTATSTLPPILEELDAARKQPGKTPDGQLVMAASGLSGRVFGALIVTGKTAVLTESERQLISTFAHQLGAALELQQVRSDLSDARERSLATRRQMMDRGIRMLAVCAQCRNCFSDEWTTCPNDDSALDTSGTLPFRVADRYEFRRLLGVGGMGEVYAAVDSRLERDVAIKVIRAGRIDPDSRARFEREARAVARIRHDNVIAIFDSGELEDGSAFLITELLEGADLGEVLRTYGVGRINQVADLVAQGAAALRAVHTAGLVHRDVKPTNLFLTDAEGAFQVKLVDFGIAKGVDFDSHLTHSGAIIGTPAYMAPEQFTDGTCDWRSDLFSFAAVVYEALTGIRLSGSTGPLAAVWSAMKGPVIRPSVHRRSVSASVDRLLLGALGRNPADRPDIEVWSNELVSALRCVNDDECGWPTPLHTRSPSNHSTSKFVAANDAKSTVYVPPPV